MPTSMAMRLSLGLPDKTDKTVGMVELSLTPKKKKKQMTTAGTATGNVTAMPAKKSRRFDCGERSKQ